MSDAHEKRKNIVINIRDKAYEKRLAAFIAYYYGETVGVECGSAPEGVAEAYYLFTDEPDAEHEGYCGVFGFSEGECNGKINLFSSAVEIGRKIIELIDESDRSSAEETVRCANAPGERETVQNGRIAAVYSPSGGVGKSTLSVTLAQTLSVGYGERVLYISNEDIMAFNTFFPAVKNNLSDCLYSYFYNMEEFESVLDGACGRSAEGVYYIAPSRGENQLNKLNSEEIEGFFGELKKHFSAVVIDMNSSLSNANTVIMNLADSVFLISGGFGRNIAGLNEKNRVFCEYVAREMPGVLPKIYYAEIEGEGGSLRKGKNKESFFQKREPGETNSFIIPVEKALWEEENGRLRINRESRYYSCVEKVGKKLRNDWYRAS